eukprot:gene20807-biopygen16141
MAIFQFPAPSAPECHVPRVLSSTFFYSPASVAGLKFSGSTHFTTFSDQSAAGSHMFLWLADIVFIAPVLRQFECGLDSMHPAVHSKATKRRRTRTGRGPHDRMQRNGRGPDADRTIECKGTDADRTRADELCKKIHLRTSTKYSHHIIAPAVDFWGGRLSMARPPRPPWGQGKYFELCKGGVNLRARAAGQSGAERREVLQNRGVGTGSNVLLRVQAFRTTSTARADGMGGSPLFLCNSGRLWNKSLRFAPHTRPGARALGARTGCVGAECNSTLQRESRIPPNGGDSPQRGRAFSWAVFSPVLDENTQHEPKVQGIQETMGERQGVP